MNGVIAQKMRIGFHRTQIVDGDDMQVSASRFDNESQNIAANAPEAVDRHSHGHLKTPWGRRVGTRGWRLCCFALGAGRRLMKRGFDSTSRCAVNAASGAARRRKLGFDKIMLPKVPYRIDVMRYSRDPVFQLRALSDD